jgi:Tocopherol cyclase
LLVVIDAYRRLGADPPFGDPRRYHGVAMEGYFWRFTQARVGRVAIVLCGVSRSGAGTVWAYVGVATYPGRFFRWAALPDAHVDPRSYGVRAGDAFACGPGFVHVDLGPDCRLDAALDGGAGWSRALGALGPAQLVPGLSQYWHPHLFTASARGVVVADHASFALDGARAYAEKNWGRGFPDTWWWGHAHDFRDDDVSVAFAGGPVRVGPARLPASAVVVRLDGAVLRSRPPASMSLGDGSWRLRARSGTRLIEVEGHADPATAHSLAVPLPHEQRVVDRSHHHLAGALNLRVTRRGRPVYAGESVLAGLERGGFIDPAVAS